MSSPDVMRAEVSYAPPLGDPVEISDVAGRPVAAHYGSPMAEYAALRTGASLFDRGHRHRLRLGGARGAELLTGLVTNDVQALMAGHGLYAAALTPKGKIVADLRVFSLGSDDGLLVDAPARAAAGWLDVVKKYVNPRLAPYRDVSATLRCIGVYGVGARHLVADALAFNAPALAALPPYGHLRIEPSALDALAPGGAPSDALALVAHVPDLMAGWELGEDGGAVDGYDLFVPAAVAPVLWERLRAAGAQQAGLEAFDVARVEAGRPEWGVDITDATIPQEANFDDLRAISYTKGCYTGQETVARVHFRGHVNRHLRGLRFAADALPPLSAGLFDGEGKSVGDVRTAARSPRLGAIALGMVRREIVEGAALVARWEKGEAAATVHALPLVDA